MPKRPVLIPTLKLDELAAYHQDTVGALRLYFSRINPRFEERFVGKTQDEVDRELQSRLDESELRSSFVVLTSLEANFQVDFGFRCRKKLKDDLSRHFRKLEKERGTKVHLEDILEGWKAYGGVPPAEIGEVRGAFKFRHWFAHGRYSEWKFGRKRDFFTVRLMAERITSEFPFTA